MEKEISPNKEECATFTEPDKHLDIINAVNPIN